MKVLRYALALVLCSIPLLAHPMGNFSINHYSKIELRQGAPELTYILDFAEIPTSQLMADFGDGKAAASQWADGLTVTVDSKRIPLKWSSVQAKTSDGAGGMPVLRVVMKGNLAAVSTGELAYSDGNFPDRTGWKEVVITHAAGVTIAKATHSGQDLSKGLTEYPADLTVTPPQDLTAAVSWHAEGAPVPTAAKHHTVLPVATAAAPVAPASVTPAPFVAQQNSSAAGTVKRGDYLSRMLQEKHFGLTAILLGLLAAFGLGAMHALSPGHGKTIVAAYLVGSRGTLKHAGILGMTVTFTHTISVFLLGLGVLFFQKYIIPEKVVPILGAVSGLSVVAIGAYLLYKRATALVGLPSGTPSHPHPQRHSRSHSHSRSSGHAHSHSHGGSTHSHAIPENITMGSLLGLGVSGGLVPCPSALILLLSAISLGQVAVGLALLGAFSAGLAVVLMAVGGLVVYGKSLLPRRKTMADHPVMRLMPVFSSVVVIVMGLLMTLTAAGVIQPAKIFI